MEEIRKNYYIAQLETIRDVKQKTEAVRKLKVSLSEKVQEYQPMSDQLAEYTRELNLLQQEKLSHVEQLRQIHADMNILDGIIKESQEEIIQNKDKSRQYYNQLIEIREGLDSDRAKLGLNPSKLLTETDMEELGVRGSASHDVSNAYERMSPVVGPASTEGQSGVLGLPLIELGLSGMASFIRQNPPPMKPCMSCHQQIHRNAPICPLCKAKSRSQNPKKPRKGSSGGL